MDSLSKLNFARTPSLNNQNPESPSVFDSGSSKALPNEGLEKFHEQETDSERPLRTGFPLQRQIARSDYIPNDPRLPRKSQIRSQQPLLRFPSDHPFTPNAYKLERQNAGCWDPESPQAFPLKRLNARAESEHDTQPGSPMKRLNAGAWLRDDDPRSPHFEHPLNKNPSTNTAVARITNPIDHYYHHILGGPGGGTKAAGGVSPFATLFSSSSPTASPWAFAAPYDDSPMDELAHLCKARRQMFSNCSKDNPYKWSRERLKDEVIGPISRRIQELEIKLGPDRTLKAHRMSL
jgi:hypothetical protein